MENHIARFRLAAPVALALALAGAPAAADCYADYKAKRDDPLQLHYGVIALPDSACATPMATEADIAARIAVDGWTLLTVVSVFDETGLTDEERRSNAGAFYLRY
jgi:hypothetical protein